MVHTCGVYLFSSINTCRENILSIFPLQISEGCLVVNNNKNKEFNISINHVTRNMIFLHSGKHNVVQGF